MGISSFDPNKIQLLQKVEQLESVVSATSSNYKTAFIRNLNEPYIIPAGRSLLQNDGLRPGGINTFGYDIWDATTQTLRPNKLGERFFVRFTFSVKASVSPVINLSVEAGGFKIASPAPFQPYVLDQWEPESLLISFFVGGAFAPDGVNIVNGAQFFVDSTQEVMGNSLSYDIFTFGGNN